MPRIARLVAVGLPHHITQRGNYKQDVFLDDSDMEKYLCWIQEYSNKYKLSISAYCLMQNHVHFIATPEKEDSLAKTFNTAHMKYSHYFNKKLKVHGHLWQGRFYSCVMDEPHLIVAARYIERNPVRAKLINSPWEWPWSSAKAHIGNKEQSQIRLKNIFEIIDNMLYDTWKDYIDLKEDKETVDAIRTHTLTGRPLGTGKFIEVLEKQFGRRLTALPVGRQRRNDK